MTLQLCGLAFRIGTWARLANMRGCWNVILPTLLMRQTSISDQFQPEELEWGWYSILAFSPPVAANDPPIDERLARIWELAAAEPRAAVERLLAEGKQLLESDDDDRFRDFRKREDEFKDCLAKLLSSVLASRELFSPCWLPHDTPPLDERDYQGDPEITHLVSKGIESLSQRDLERLNRILVEDALRHYLFWQVGSRPWGSSYLFEEHVSFWTKVLTDVEVIHPPQLKYGQQWPHPCLPRSLSTLAIRNTYT